MHLWVFFYSNSCCSVFKPVSFIFGPKCIFSHCTLLDVDMPSKKKVNTVSLNRKRWCFFAPALGGVGVIQTVLYSVYVLSLERLQIWLCYLSLHFNPLRTCWLQSYMTSHTQQHLLPNHPAEAELVSWLSSPFSVIREESW